MKRIKSLLFILFTAVFLLATTITARAQDEEPVSPVSIGADIMSRYVWRGLDYGASPSIQPCLEVGIGNFAIGAWGAYAVTQTKNNESGTQEMDLYANYTIAEMITVGVTDYFFPMETGYNYDYFDYGSDTSLHVLEGMVAFNGLKDLPLTFMVGVNVMNDNDHSLYLELGYSFSFIDVFMGAGNGIYLTSDNKFNLVNVGISKSKDLEITESFSLPVSVSLITNPDAKQVHLVFGISF